MRNSHSNLFKSTRLDEVPSPFFKDWTEVLTMPISSIVNAYLASGIPPDQLNQQGSDHYSRKITDFICG